MNCFSGHFRSIFTDAESHKGLVRMKRFNTRLNRQREITRCHNCYGPVSILYYSAICFHLPPIRRRDTCSRRKANFNCHFYLISRDCVSTRQDSSSHLEGIMKTPHRNHTRNHERNGKQCTNCGIIDMIADP